MRANSNPLKCNQPANQRQRLSQCECGLEGKIAQWMDGPWSKEKLKLLFGNPVIVPSIPTRRSAGWIGDGKLGGAAEV